MGRGRRDSCRTDVRSIVQHFFQKLGDRGPELDAIVLLAFGLVHWVTLALRHMALFRGIAASLVRAHICALWRRSRPTRPVLAARTNTWPGRAAADVRSPSPPASVTISRHRWPTDSRRSPPSWRRCAALAHHQGDPVIHTVADMGHPAFFKHDALAEAARLRTDEQSAMVAAAGHTGLWCYAQIPSGCSCRRN